MGGRIVSSPDVKARVPRAARPDIPRVLRLLQEYLGEAKRWEAAAAALLVENERAAWKRREAQYRVFRQWVPAVEDLARHASQILTHADLAVLDEIEVKLRLRELEIALKAAEERHDQLIISQA